MVNNSNFQAHIVTLFTQRINKLLVCVCLYVCVKTVALSGEFIRMLIFFLPAEKEAKDDGQYFM